MVAAANAVKHTG
ncbi:hypothetical protein D049_1820A, partial [Vibrio parahaemolyticus VPTS-2010]